MKSIPCSVGEQDTKDDVYRQMTQDSSSGGVSDNLQPGHPGCSYHGLEKVIS